MDDHNYENVIEIKNLCKTYDGFSLKNLNITVPKGTIMGFVGQNGAGKTTTIKSILNIIKKEQGEIRLFGLDNEYEEITIKNRIGVVFDELPFHEQLTPSQLNKILTGIFSSWDDACFFHYLERFSLPQKKKIAAFSKGMKMKLQIAAALSHNAELLIMDEATSGLDPVVRDELIDLLLDFARDENHAILISSHIVSDLEKLCDTIAFLHKGQLLLCEDKDALRDEYALWHGTAEQLAERDDSAILSRRTTPYGAEALVRREGVPAGSPLTPVSIEELFVQMVKGEDRT